MVEFKDIPDMVKVLIITVILLVVGVIIFGQMGRSGILPVETWANDTVAVAANGTTPTGFRISLSADNVKSITRIQRADNGTILPSTNYTLYKEQGYLTVPGSDWPVNSFSSTNLNITGYYYNDAVLDQGIGAFATFASWLGIMVVILLAGVIFGLFKYFGSSGEEAF